MGKPICSCLVPFILHQTDSCYYEALLILFLTEKKSGYNELFSDGYNPDDDDLDLHITDDEDDEIDGDMLSSKSKRRHSSTGAARSRSA